MVGILGQFRSMFKGDISVSFRDGHPPNSSGVCMSIIRIPYERWDDHPQYREFLKNIKFTDCTHLLRNLRNSTYIGQPLFGFCWNSCVCVSEYVYICISKVKDVHKTYKNKNILECVHIYSYTFTCYTQYAELLVNKYMPPHTSREPSFSSEHSRYVLFSASVHLSCALVQAMVAKNWRNLATESHGFPSLPQLLLTTETGKKLMKHQLNLLTNLGGF